VGHPRSGQPLTPPGVTRLSLNLHPDLSEWIGYTAAALTTSSFVPQALLTLRTRDVSGISVGMYGAFTAGVALWLVYGVVLRSWPIIVANALTVTLAGTILVTKIVVERRRRAAQAGAGAGAEDPAA